MRIREKQSKWDIFNNVVESIVSLSEVTDIDDLNCRNGFVTLLQNAIVEAVHEIEVNNDIDEFEPFVIRCDGLV